MYVPFSEAVRGSAGASSEGKRVETLIAFTCGAKAHQASEAGPDKWTVHEGKWAYCGYDARAHGHEWKPNEGLTLSMLQQTGAIRVHTGGEDPTKKR